MDNESIQNDEALEDVSDFQCGLNELSFDKRECPKCGMDTISGMRGSADAICKNCGYKDPCCFD